MTLANSNHEYYEKEHQVFNFDQNLSYFDNVDHLEEPLCIPHDSLETLDYWFTLWSSTDPTSVDFMFSNTSETENNKELQQHEYQDEENDKRMWNMRKYFGNLQFLLKSPNKSTKFRKCRTKIQTRKIWKSRKNVLRWNDFKIGGRRCSHCESTNTPQWRNGPLGPKTLCNACGVRYKSGRLLPQ